jgi:hypothetical protein
MLSRIRAALGAAMVIAIASPVAAHAQRPAARVRVEAQWLERRGATRQWLRWRVARRPLAAVAWRRGYARGFAMGRFPLRAGTWGQAYYSRSRGSVRARMYGRFWDRRRVGRMGGRWSI